MNCASKDQRIVFARYLEEIWMHIGTNKLSEPFLRPLLPFDPPSLPISMPMPSSSTTSSNSTSSSSSLTSPLLLSSNSPTLSPNIGVDEEMIKKYHNSSSPPQLLPPSVPQLDLDMLIEKENNNNMDRIITKTLDNDSKNETDEKKSVIIDSLDTVVENSDVISSCINSTLEESPTTTSKLTSTITTATHSTNLSNLLENDSTELLDFYSILIRIRTFHYQTNFESFLSDIECLSNLIKTILKHYCTQIQLNYDDPVYQNYVEIILQSFATSIYHITNMSNEKRKKLIEDFVTKSTTTTVIETSSQKTSQTIDEKLFQLWRRECNMNLTDIRELYLAKNYFGQTFIHKPFIISRSIQSWCHYLNTSQLSQPYSYEKEKDNYINQLVSYPFFVYFH